jgi:exosortase
MPKALSQVRSRSQETSASSSIEPQLMSRVILFVFFCLCLVIIFWSAFVSLFKVAIKNDYCTHIFFIPFISIVLVYLDRNQIFRGFKRSSIFGTALLLVGLGLYWRAREFSKPFLANDYLAQAALSIVLLVIAGFILCFGAAAFRRASFPLLFLFLMVPLPPLILDKVIYCLQAGSTLVAYQLFQLLGVPVFHDHFTLQLPEFTIQVAKECSSIRSSLALFITGLLAARLCLRKPLPRLLVVALTIPLSVVKNGIRIVTLSILAIRVDPGFLTGKLHHEGGVVFYLIALIVLGAALQFLRFAENHHLIARRAASSALSKEEAGRQAGVWRAYKTNSTV